jgi:hypothetical protein
MYATRNKLSSARGCHTFRVGEVDIFSSNGKG